MAGPLAESPVDHPIELDAQDFLWKSQRPKDQCRPHHLQTPPGGQKNQLQFYKQTGDYNVPLVLQPPQLLHHKANNKLFGIRQRHIIRTGMILPKSGANSPVVGSATDGSATNGIVEGNPIEGSPSTTTVGAWRRGFFANDFLRDLPSRLKSHLEGG